MKKTIRTVSVALSILTLISFAGCTFGTGVEPETSPEPDTSEITEAPETEVTTEAVATAEVTTVAETTEACEVEKNLISIVGKDGKIVSTKWYKGYVGSDTNPYGYANKLNAGGGGYAYTDVIEMGPQGTRLVFVDSYNGSTSSNAYVISSWKKSSNGKSWVIDTEGTNLSGAPKAVVSSSTQGTVYQYVSSKDNECIRLCFRSNGTESTDPPTVYRTENAGTGTVNAMNESLEALNSWIASDKTRADYSSVLSGKTVYCMGDSYLAGNGIDPEYHWLSILSKKYSVTVVNKGINGSSMSNYTSDNNPMVSRLDTLPAQAPDIFILQGGKNDYNINCPLGTVDSTDTKTFYGALNYLVTNIQAKYPNAVLICVTPWKVSSTNGIGLTVTQYGEAMITYCNAHGIPVIDATNQTESKVYMTDLTFRTTYCMNSGDVSHLNADGMKLVFPFFEKYIAEFYTAGKK